MEESLLPSKHTNSKQFDATVKFIRTKLNTKIISLIGMMGSGKSTVGSQLANLLNIPFIDSDKLIEDAANLPIPEIFSDYGEEKFRDLEKRVILNQLTQGPMVLATGGGSFLNADSRTAIQKAGVVIWLNANLDVLYSRVQKSKNRPLLQNTNPKATLAKLLDERSKIYKQADIQIESNNDSTNIVIEKIILKLSTHLRRV